MSVEGTCKVRILLVDDSDVFVRSTLRLFEDYPELATVSTARSAEEALKLPAQPAPRLILLDRNLRGMSGLQAVHLLRAKWPHAHIILLSFDDGASYRQLAEMAGADGFMTKPAMVDELIPTIIQIGKHHQELPPL
jgi:DNA-binding NarL/FixJ family response regulator